MNTEMHKLQHELNKEYALNQMTIWKEQDKSQIRINEDFIKKINAAFIKTQQELKSYEVVVSTEGYYYLRISTPKGYNSKAPSTSIFHVPIEATLYYAANYKGAILSIRFSDHYIKLPIADVKAAIRSFIATVESCGLTIYLSSRLKKEIAPQLLQQIINNAKPIELPLSSGWNQMDNGEWRYVSREEITMEDLEDEY